MSNRSRHTERPKQFSFLPKFAGVPQCSLWLVLFAVFSLTVLVSCSAHPSRGTLVMDIESSPVNLDPRVGTDSQSERIADLIFDPLVRTDAHFNLLPWVAERWELPDPRTYVFHLRKGIVFHDGRPLTARDVKWTLDSYQNGTVVSIRAATYRHVVEVDALDEYTVVIHLDEPDSTLLWNLSDGAFGIVPYGSGKELTVKPIGSGPFRFVSLEQDNNVILERNDHYWAKPPNIERVRMNVVPDATTRALELRKGSADLVATNSLGADMVNTLRRDFHLKVQREPGTGLVYLAFNLRDPILRDSRVREAMAYAIDRQPILDYLFGGYGRLADSVLPQESGTKLPHSRIASGVQACCCSGV